MGRHIAGIAVAFLRRHAVACLVLFVVLAGGTAFAAGQVADNSVGTKQLKRNAVNSSRVKNGSLKARDFKPGQLPAGKQGPQGPPGQAGPPGAAGDAVAAAYVNVGTPPTFASARTHGFTAVSSTTVGSQIFYCLTAAAGVDLSSNVAVVSPVYNSGFAGAPQLATVVSPNTGSCPAGRLEIEAGGSFDLMIIVG